MRRLFILLVLLLVPAPAAAAVQITFYSREAGIRFPHAFVVLSGALEANGAPVSASFGFTTRHANPLTAVRRAIGAVAPVDQDFIDRSVEHFSLTLSDEAYVQVLERVEAWRAAPQPSYDLDRANCVFFVADIARAAGLSAEPAPGLMLRPRLFLQQVGSVNQPLIENRRAVAPGAPAAIDEISRAPGAENLQR